MRGFSSEVVSDSPLFPRASPLSRQTVGQQPPTAPETVHPRQGLDQTLRLPCQPTWTTNASSCRSVLIGASNSAKEILGPFQGT